MVIRRQEERKQTKKKFNMSILWIQDINTILVPGHSENPIEKYRNWYTKKDLNRKMFHHDILNNRHLGRNYP